MALNYTHRPIYPARLPEENVVHGGSQERDIHDILPDDPFGMDISSTFTAAITGWLGDLGGFDYGGCRGGEVGVGDKGHYPIFAGLNFWWDTDMGFQPHLGWNKNDNTMVRGGRFDGFATEEVLGRSVVDSGVRYGCFSTDNVGFDCGGAYVHEHKNVFNPENLDSTMFMGSRFDQFVTDSALGDVVGINGVHHGCETMMKDVMFDCGDIGVDGDENGVAVSGIVDETDDGSPHMSLSFALAYLDIRDLLVVERVCKSLRHTIQNDPLLWKNIQIDHPLNDRITDDVLLQLTSRAQGHLQCLSLVECKGVTDDGLRRVLGSNMRLTKLSVSGCIKITTEGVLSCLKAFQREAVTGIKCLRVAGHVVTSEQFEELILLLGVHKHMQPNHHKPRFFNRENIYVSCEDDRPIDIEVCPKCEKLKLVYSCTAESCQVTDQTTQTCRACATCIPRCEQCGRCVFNLPHVETFCLGYQCTDCSPEELKCHEGHVIGSSSSVHVVSCELDG